MRIAIVEEGQINPSRDAGARAISDLQDSLGRLGFKSQMFYENDTLRRQIKRYRPRAIVVSRPQQMARCSDFKELFGQPVIFWAQDFHSRRQSLGEKLSGMSAHSSFVMSLVEKSALFASDISVFPTLEEANAVTRRFSLGNIETHPYFSFANRALINKEERKKNLVFIGGSGHEPNLDGLGWFLNNCWPSVQNLFPETQLIIIGNWQNSNLVEGSHQAVKFMGNLPEEGVESILQSSLIGISPLRFGAGIKRKTLQYLNAGLATVATDFGLEGLPRAQNKSWYRANTEVEFVNAISRILGGGIGPGTVAKTGKEFILKNYSVDKYDDRLKQILVKSGL